MPDKENLTSIATSAAPAAIGPYSQAVVAGNLLFVSGQIPLEPESGELVGGDIESQTRRVLDNLKAIIQAAGADMDRVVKTTIFLADMNDFAAVNGVYAEYFKATLPARATVQVAGLPKGVPVEIEAVVLLK